MNSKHSPWWEQEAIYQVYSLSFADGNGDGKGDLAGITQRLDYLNDGQADSETSLGIDAIWITPVNSSPMVDNGYDISNYYDICPTFGTLDYPTRGQNKYGSTHEPHLLRHHHHWHRGRGRDFGP